MSKESKVENIEDRPYTFKPNDMQLAEQVRTLHHLWVPSGVTLEQATNVKSFAHIAGKLRAGDEIIVRSESDDFYATVLVRAVKSHDVVVKVLRETTDLNSAPIPEEEDPEFEVKYINGRYKWGFKYRGQSNWIINGLQTQEEALRSLDDHRKALAA